MEKKENQKDNFKQKIAHIDNQIDTSQSKIRKINDIQEELTALNKNLNKCIELLSISIRGKKKEKILNDMAGQNQKLYANFSSSLDDEILLTRKRISNLTEEKENLIKENKNKKE